MSENDNIEVVEAFSAEVTDEGDVVADPGEAHRGRDAGEGAADDGDAAHQAGAGFLRRLSQRW